MRTKYRIVEITDHLGTYFCPQVRILGLFWTSFLIVPSYNATLEDALKTIKQSKKKRDKKRKKVYLLDDQLNIKT